jgi:hypothetical protein
MPSLIITTALRLPKSHRLVRKTDGKGRGEGEENADRNLLGHHLPDSVNRKFGSTAGAGLNIGRPRSLETRGSQQGIRDAVPVTTGNSRRQINQ